MSVRSCKAREKRGTDALGGFGFCPNAGVRAKNIVNAVAIALRLDNRNAVTAVKLPSCNTKKLTGAVYHRGFLRSRLLTICLKSKRDWIILVFPELLSPTKNVNGFIGGLPGIGERLEIPNLQCIYHTVPRVTTNLVQNRMFSMECFLWGRSRFLSCEVYSFRVQSIHFWHGNVQNNDFCRVGARF